MNKQTLVLLPGLLCDETMWQRQCDDLADIATIDVVTYQQYDSLQTILDETMPNLPDKFALAGHSMGGWLALEMAIRFPERISQLCLLSTNAGEDSEAKIRQRLQLIQLAEQGEFDKIATVLTNAFAYDQQLKSQLKVMFKSNAPYLINQQSVLLVRNSLINTLTTIDIPTLAIVGNQDQEFIDATNTIAELIPNAELDVINGAGHMLTLEQPEAVSRSMRHWLS